jgi:hypothetical protein
MNGERQSQSCKIASFLKHRIQFSSFTLIQTACICICTYISVIAIRFVKVKVKVFRYKPDVGSRRLRLLPYEGGKVATLTHRPPLPPGVFLVLIFRG